MHSSVSSSPPPTYHPRKRRSFQEDSSSSRYSSSIFRHTYPLLPRYPIHPSNILNLLSKMAPNEYLFSIARRLRDRLHGKVHDINPDFIIGRDKSSDARLCFEQHVEQAVKKHGEKEAEKMLECFEGKIKDIELEAELRVMETIFGPEFTFRERAFKWGKKEKQTHARAQRVRAIHREEAERKERESETRRPRESEQGPENVERGFRCQGEKKDRHQGTQRAGQKDSVPRSKPQVEPRRGAPAQNSSRPFRESRSRCEEKKVSWGGHGRETHSCGQDSIPGPQPQIRLRRDSTKREGGEREECQCTPGQAQESNVGDLGKGKETFQGSHDKGTQTGLQDSTSRPERQTEHRHGTSVPESSRRDPRGDGRYDTERNIFQGIHDHGTPTAFQDLTPHFNPWAEPQAPTPNSSRPARAYESQRQDRTIYQRGPDQGTQAGGGQGATPYPRPQTEPYRAPPIPWSTRPADEGDRDRRERGH